MNTPRVPATNQSLSALATTGDLRRPYVGTCSNIKTMTGPPQAGRPVKSHNNRNVALPGPPPAARNPVNQAPRAVPPHRRGPSLATAKVPHHAVCAIDAMADSGKNRRFTLPPPPKQSTRVTADHHARTGSPAPTPLHGQHRPAHAHRRPDLPATAPGEEEGQVPRVDSERHGRRRVAQRCNPRSHAARKQPRQRGTVPVGTPGEAGHEQGWGKFPNEKTRRSSSGGARMVRSRIVCEVATVDKIGKQQRHENSRAKAVTQHSHTQHPDQGSCS